MTYIGTIIEINIEMIKIKYIIILPLLTLESVKYVFGLILSK